MLPLQLSHWCQEGCLQQQGVDNPSMSAIRNSITRNELSRHCWRRTRGVELTLELIEGLLLQLSGPFATDSSSEPLSLCSVTRWSPSGKKRRSIWSAYRVQMGLSVTLSQATSPRVGLKCQCLVCVWDHLTGVVSPPPGRVCRCRD